MKKVVIVTGASSELGLNVIEKLLERDYKIYALARDIEKIQLKHETLSKKTLDLTDKDSCKKVMGEIGNENESLDVLVNIAAITVSGETLKSTEEEFSDVLKVNVLGMFNIIKYFIKEKGRNNKAKIVNITSMVGFVAFPNFGIYSASKSAQEALGLSLRYELKKDHITVTNIAPGAIEKKDKKVKKSHKRTAREKFTILRHLMPILSSKDVAKAIVRVVEIENPPARIIVGWDARIVFLLQKILPFSLFDKLMLFVWTKK